MGFPGGSDGKECASNVGGTQVQSLSQEDLEQRMTTHSSNLAGELRGQRSLEGYSPWGHKVLDMTERLTHTAHQHIFNLQILKKGKHNVSFSKNTSKIWEKLPAKLDRNYYLVFSVFTLCHELFLFKSLKSPWKIMLIFPKLNTT